MRLWPAVCCVKVAVRFGCRKCFFAFFSCFHVISFFTRIPFYWGFKAI